MIIDGVNKIKRKKIQKLHKFFLMSIIYFKNNWEKMGKRSGRDGLRWRSAGNHHYTTYKKKWRLGLRSLHGVYSTRQISFYTSAQTIFTEIRQLCEDNNPKACILLFKIEKNIIPHKKNVNN